MVKRLIKNKCYYDNGQLKTHCYYKNGKLDGEYIIFKKDGTIQSRCCYKLDKKAKLNKNN